MIHLFFLYIKRCYFFWHLFYFSLIFSTTFYLCGCAVFNKRLSLKKTPVPLVRTIMIPGGNSSNWRYIGTTSIGHIINEIDDSSIKKIDNQVCTFQDRKTIADINNFTYLNNQPHYKYLISQWLINCQTSEYLLKNVTMYNEQSNIIKFYDYNKDKNIRWLQIGAGSISEAQYKYICQNQDRMIGY